MKKISQDTYVTYNGMELIPLCEIEAYHRDDYVTFLTWMRGKTVVILKTVDDLGVFVYDYNKWFASHY